MVRRRRECLAGKCSILSLGVEGAPAGRPEDVLARALPGAGAEDSDGAAGESLLA